MDGQNLFHAAREAFHHRVPDYDILALGRALCRPRRWQLMQTRFYTGFPTVSASPFWARFWERKLARLGRKGVVTFSRPLRYRNHTVRLPDATTFTMRTAEEKGVDVRIALDVIRLAHRRVFDVALVVSQDQDFAEVASEIRVIAREQHRWIKIASAFPLGPATRNRRGINGTDWIPIEQETYERCIERIAPA